MSSISAGTSSGTALVQSGDTTGALVIKTGGSAATAATFNADQSVTLAQPLPVASGGTGATSLSGITVGTATSATTATNLSGGSGGTIPYQTSSGTTAMLAAGTSGYLLQSNGTSAPSWTAAPTPAGSITAVATGTLPNGATVIVNSDGTVSVPAATGSDTLTTVATSALNASTSTAITGNPRTVSACYNSKDNTIALFFIGVSNTYVYCIPGKIVGSTISWGTSTVVNSSYAVASGSNYGISSAYDYTNNQFFCIFRQSNNGNGGWCRVKFDTNLQFNSYGVSANSWATTNPYPFGYSIIISPTLNGSVTQGMLIWKSGSSNQIYVNGISVTNNNLSIGADTFVINNSGGGGSYQMIPTFCDTSAKALIAYIHPSGWPLVSVVNLNGTSATVNTAVQLSSDNASNYSIAVGYSPTLNKYFVGWGSASSVNGSVVTISGNTPSAGSAAVISGFSPGSGDYLYNCVCYALTGDLWFQVDAYLMRIVISGTTFTVNGSPTYFPYAQYPAYPGNMFYDSANNTFVMPSSSGGSPYYPQLAFVTAYSTTLTANNFIGFSSASYTNGQTATINTVGSTNTGVTGLTAGTGYYVTPNGSLSSASTANYAGVALSATKILVKG